MAHPANHPVKMIKIARQDMKAGQGLMEVLGRQVGQQRWK